MNAAQQTRAWKPGVKIWAKCCHCGGKIKPGSAIHTGGQSTHGSCHDRVTHTHPNHRGN